MPIRKFRNLEDMADALWHDPGDPGLLSAIARVWDFAQRTCRPAFPPGVYRHRTIEDAQALRDRWEEANFRAYWERRGEKP